MEQQNNVLRAVLGCGTLDLPLLDNIQYDLYNMIQDLKDDDRLDFNELLAAVFDKGKHELQDAVNDKINELAEELENAESEEEQQQIQSEIDELETLDTEKDIEYYTNCLDTHIYFTDEDKKEIYYKYLADEIEQVENNMGFDFSG